MSASSLNAVRVRLCFDCPPPAVSDCRMCWLFVDLNDCSMVEDVVSVIREKFGFNPGTILNLLIDDCYFPPKETVYVLRDNDSIRVKVENQPPVNDIEASSKPEGQFQKANKRLREADEDNEGLKNTALTEGQEVDPQPVVEVEMKKKRKKSKEKTLPVKPPAAAAPVKSPAVSKSAAMPVPMPSLPVPTPSLPDPTPPLPVAKPPLPGLINQFSSTESSDSSEELPPEKGAEVNFPVPSTSWDSSPGPAVAKPVPKKTAPPSAGPSSCAGGKSASAKTAESRLKRKV